MSNRKIIHTIHNSDDDKLYEIALDVKQKLQSNTFMPDYEIKQNKFHKFGHVILGYHMDIENYYPLFQSTGKIVQDKIEDNWYYSKIYVDSQNFKTNLVTNSDSNQIKTHNKYVKAIFEWESNDDEWKDYSEIEVYDFQDESWNPLTTDSDDNFNYNVSTRRGILNCTTTNGYVYIRTKNKYIDTSSTLVEYYTAMHINVNSETNENTSIFVYKNKQWYYIATPNLDNICVKKGGMKYRNGIETIWKITGKNTPWDAIYMGRGRNACGHSKTNEEALGSSGTLRRKWKKLNFDFLSQNTCSFKNKGSKYYNFSENVKGNYVLVIENGSNNDNNSNRFELYKYIITNPYGTTTYYHRKNFLRYLSLEEVYGLNKKVNTQIKLDTNVSE